VSKGGGMNLSGFWYFVLLTLGVIGLFIAGTYLMQYLWNYYLVLFGSSVQFTFWQTVGINTLFTTLFSASSIFKKK
jgi:hypothetical protein